MPLAGHRRAADRVDITDQFIAATRQLIGAQRAEACGMDTARFGIAVSGGPDSLALLLLAHQTFPGRVAAATVDHQLRPESAAEAEHVARYCAQLGVTHRILVPDQPIAGSLQAAARKVRYALLGQWREQQAIDWLMTAHHADDQMETMLMRLNRASGVGGLAGIRSRQGRLLRPLLGMRRADLVQLVADNGWSAVDDPSNRDMRFDRVRVRRALAAIAGDLDPVSAASSALALAEADQALIWMTDRLVAERMVAGDIGLTIDINDLPAELERRLIARALATIAPDRAAPRGEALSRAMTLLAGGRTAMLGDVILSQSPDGVVTLRPSPKRRRSE